MKVNLLGVVTDKHTGKKAVVIRHKVSDESPCHNDWCTEYSIKDKRIRKIRYKVAYVINWKVYKEFFRWTPTIKVYKYKKTYISFAWLKKTFLLTWKRL